MQFARHHYPLIWSFLLVISASCTKKDGLSPVLVVNDPVAGMSYQVFDTIVVSVHAIDETQLVWVTAKVVSESFVPVTASSSIPIDQNTGNGSAEIVLSDKLMPTADYYVLVTAFDGTNEALEFVKIRINAIPKKRRAIYFSSSDNGIGTIWKIDSLFQGIQQWVQPNQDVLKLCVNSLKDQLTLVGEFSTGILSYSLPHTMLNWSDQAFSAAQTPRFNDLFCFENTVYTSLFDSELRAYSSTGGLLLNRPTLHYRPELIYADSDYLVAELSLIGSNEHQLHVYQRATNALLWQVVLPMDIIAICPYRNDEVLVYGNDGQQARVLHYDMGENAYWEPRQLPAGLVHDAVKMDDFQYAISHDNGLYVYTYSPNFLNLVRGGTVYQDLVFDADHGTIIGASQNMVEEISVMGQVLNSQSHSSTIGSIDIHYTR